MCKESNIDVSMQKEEKINFREGGAGIAETYNPEVLVYIVGTQIFSCV
jgi:hypothetical protein